MPLTSEEARALVQRRWEKHAAALRAAAGEAPVSPLAPLAHLADPDLAPTRARTGTVIARTAQWLLDLIQPRTATSDSAS